MLTDAEVWLLHLRKTEVMPRAGVFPTESNAEALSAVEHAATKLNDAGIKTHYEVRDTLHGEEAREIVATARAYDVGIIVMGSRGRGDLVGLVLGSTAHKVIHFSDRPVLVVR